MDREFLTVRIERTKDLIVLYEEAVTALSTGGILSYTLDTGQSRQTVTRMDVVRLSAELRRLYNQLVTLQARLCGGGTYVRPGY